MIHGRTSLRKGNSRRKLQFCTVATLAILILSPVAWAWDEDGHAIIAHLAIDALPTEMPEWIRTPEVRERLAYLSSEPDRWRGQHHPVLDHINNLDHYLDEEKLYPYGLSLKTLPKFRIEYTDMLATKRATDPAVAKAVGTRQGRDHTGLSPGMLPYRIAELQWQVAAGWTQLKTYEAHPENVTEGMIRNARENIVYSMGILAHYVGDGSQPLHLTKHHHGWVGENLAGYTRDKKFHAFIDGGVIELHQINYDDLKERARPIRRISAKHYWRDINAYLYETFELVEPLYSLEKTGELKGAKGKRFIEDRLLDGGAALAGIWAAAYQGSHLDEFRIKRLKSSDGTPPGRRKEAPRKAAMAD